MNKKPEGSPISFPEPASAAESPGAASVRVLVVDDYEPFRRFVCSTLKKRSGLDVVGEASGGLEAVQKAEELRPDLIVLDIGLPTLNGIEAARRIRKSNPESKILFLSQESSADVAQEGLLLGALAYVVKAHAGSELLAAVDAVCQGRQFISKGISGYDYARTTAAQVPDQSLGTVPSTSHEPGQRGIDRSHEVQFYSEEASFLVGIAAFAEGALRAENAVIIVATKSHRESLQRSLQEHGVNITTAIGKGRYVPLDVDELLATFMENTGPNRIRFFSTFGSLIRRAQTAAGVQYRVVVFGEMVAILCAEGRIEAAIEVEQLWDELARTHLFHLRCAYPMTAKLKGKPYASICAAHSAVLPG